MNDWLRGKRLYNGKYKIEEVLEEGGFGIIYLATNDKGEQFAIKTPTSQLQNNSQFQYFQKCFLDEAERLKKCQHQNIVKFYDFFQEGQIPCIVMEYIEGKNLSKIVSEQGVLEESCALSYIQQIGEALAFIHSKKIIHRDIKPENIILRENSSEVVLIDLGIARELTPNQTNSHTKAYTDGYAPLEQYGFNQDKPANYTDVYALAATLYVLLTGYGQGNKPASNYLANAIERYLKVEKSQADPLKAPQHINKNISDRVNYAILQGMKIQAANRPQTVQKWLALLHLNSSMSQGQTLQLPGIKSLSQIAVTHYNRITNKLLLGSIFFFVAVIYFYSPYLTLSQRSDPIKPPDQSQSPELAPTEKLESPPIAKNKETQPASEKKVKTLDIDYKPLQNLLSSQKFEDADRETLSIMLLLVERQKQDWFEVQNIKNIPCTDLHKINQLWLDYSDRRFGFSVQKQIWTEVGGETGVYDVQVTDRFIDRVGWNGKYRRYDNITYQSSAPIGHLPFRVTSRVGKFGVPYLAERLAICNIP